MMIRAFAASAVLVLAVGGLTACGGSSSSSSAFCDALSGDSDPLGATDITGDPEAFADATEAIQKLADTAPEEVADDVSTLADFFTQFKEALENAGVDVADIANADPNALLTALGSVDVDFEALNTAGNNITQYAGDECGVDISGS